VSVAVQGMSWLRGKESEICRRGNSMYESVMLLCIWTYTCHSDMETWITFLLLPWSIMKPSFTKSSCTILLANGQKTFWSTSRNFHPTSDLTTSVLTIQSFSSFMSIHTTHLVLQISP
jgi:hypothetical protein